MEMMMMEMMMMEMMMMEMIMMEMLLLLSMMLSGVRYGACYHSLVINLRWACLRMRPMEFVGRS
eukprot:653022-Hanusia_phi.AAC.1